MLVDIHCDRRDQYVLPSLHDGQQQRLLGGVQLEVLLMVQVELAADFPMDLCHLPLQSQGHAASSNAVFQKHNVYQCNSRFMPETRRESL